jgi:YidC/Oxa1 family membrane protein insertase
MLNVLYTLIIYPIEIIIEFCYVLAFRLTNSPGLSVIGISLAVSALVLPLYLMADKQQQAEREKQNQMKRMKDNIKAVFKGDKRYMLLSTLYRQHNYHPVYALRSSINIFIQVPFFIAAYHFISNMEMIGGVSFGPIADLGKPDSIIKIKTFAINILPVAMTLINLISAAVYAKGFSARDKIQLYGMAALFLILLYNSPSGLALYWTANNFLSLVKNTVQVIYRHFTKERQKPSVSRIDQDDAQSTVMFIFPLLILFLLAGFVIPSSLIGSSVQEFSFIGNYKSPFPFIANAALQSFGIFLLWPLLIYLFFSKEIKNKLTKAAVVISIAAVINSLLYPAKYGTLTVDFIFSESVRAGKAVYIVNLLVLVTVAILVLLFIKRFKKLITAGLTITVCALLVFASINSVKIYREFTAFKLQLSKRDTLSKDSVYQFSKEGKNVLVIMIDAAISGFIPYIFDEKQELYNSFDGFTWYRNAISFGKHTIYGSSGIFGGYEYTPLEMQARSGVPLAEKHNEAILMLPRIFLDQGYKVTVTDPPSHSLIFDYSIFDNYPEMYAESVIGKYDKNWLFEREKQADPVFMANNAVIIKSNLIRFSFLKIAPVLFRNFVYDNSKWLKIQEARDNNNHLGYRRTSLENYIALDVLDKITEVSSLKFNSYTAMKNNLPHEPAFLQGPDYVPANKVTVRGNSNFINESYYDVNIAALLLLGKWFDFLKENDVYDNTRIIVVSDHGRSGVSILQSYVFLPNKVNLQSCAAFLLVKDFNSRGRLSIDDSFMTNADVPLIALEGIAESPVNPWSGKIIKSDKEDGVTITSADLWNISDHPKNVFNIKPNEWLHVHTNIYDPENWKQVTVQENKP